MVFCHAGEEGALADAKAAGQGRSGPVPQGCACMRPMAGLQQHTESDTEKSPRADRERVYDQAITGDSDASGAMQDRDPAWDACRRPKRLQGAQDPGAVN